MSERERADEEWGTGREGSAQRGRAGQGPGEREGEAAGEPRPAPGPPSREQLEALREKLRRKWH